MDEFKLILSLKQVPTSTWGSSLVAIDDSGKKTKLRKENI